MEENNFWKNIENEVLELSCLSKAEQIEGIKNIIEKYKVNKTDVNEILKEKLRKQKIKDKLEIKHELNADEESKEYKKQRILDILTYHYDNAEDEVFIEAFNYDIKKAQHFFAKRLMIEYFFKTFKDNREMIVYKEHEGIYEQKGHIFIEQECKRRLGDKATCIVINEIIESIKRETFIDREILFNQPKNLKPLKNSILNLDNLKTMIFIPKYIFLNKIDIEYSNNAECPKFKKFLIEVLSEKDILILQEWLGYCLLNTTDYQKALLLYGSGANGKSVILKTIEHFLGCSNVTKISLQYLESNSFAPARLFGKSGNIFTDLPKKALSQTSIFKMVVSGDPITTEKKGKDSFEYVPYCKMMFSCNSVPRTPDTTPSFFRRWLILRFYKVFEEGSLERIERLEENFYSEEEMQGILNFAIQGLQRLKVNKRFTENMNIMEIEEFWIKRSDSVLAFFREMIELNPYSNVLKQEVYETYENYCKIRGYTKEEENNFFRRLREIWLDYEEYRPNKEEESRARQLKGIKLKKELVFE